MSGDSVRLLGEVNERTKKLENDANKVWPLLDEKVNREDCLDRRTTLCGKINECKKIAISKRSKAECLRMYNQLKEEMYEFKNQLKGEINEIKLTMKEEKAEEKSDYWQWITAILAITAIIMSGLVMVFHV